LRRRRVDRRRLRLEQAELERGLVGMLHRQPAIIAIPRIGMDAKSELADIELKRLILIAHEHACNANTLCHLGNSVLSWASLVSDASRRRFSETAIVRFGR